MNDQLSLDNSEAVERDQLMAKWKDKTKEEILEAKVNSDLFIKTKNAQFDDLKKDYLALREQHQTSTQMKEFLDRLEKERNLPSQNDQTPITNTDGVVQHSIKPEDVQNLVAQEIARNKLLDKQSQNFNVVEGKLKEVFGENYHTSYKQRRETLGLSEDFANDLARNHPSVFIKTFELESKPQDFSAPPRTQQRPISFAPTTQKRDWNYYQALKKDNPRLYLDPKIAVQMHEDAIALGPAFGMPED